MKIPVTIVTGALGAGKTTFVNYVLTAEHGLRIGVIVNEFGAVGIDSQLIATSEKEQLVELPNGCICCTVRGDLVQAAKELLATQKVDYLLVETSGLAEVVPVAQTFVMGELEEETDLDSILCIIDAEHYDENISRNLTALEQLQCSDIVLLNKIDLISEERKKEIKKDITQKVPKAQVLETVKGRAPVDLLIGVGKFDTEKPLEWEKRAHEHAHDPGIQAVACTTGPVDSDNVQVFLDNLPPNIFRAKGILCIKESQPGARDELRVIFQKVGKRTELEFSRPWEEGERKETKVVFIGTALEPKKLQKELDVCA